jgi:hypothetical protein
MEFVAKYPWFGQEFGQVFGLGAISKSRNEFVPIRFPHVAEVLRDESRRSTLRMQWRAAMDPDGKICLRAIWDARRHDRAVVQEFRE